MADQTSVMQQITALFTSGPVKVTTVITALGLLATYTATQTNNLGGVLQGNLPSPTIAPGAITSGMLAPGVLPTNLQPIGSAGGSLTGTYPNPTIAPGVVTAQMLAPGALSTQLLALNGTANIPTGEAFVCSAPGSILTLPANEPQNTTVWIADCQGGSAASAIVVNKSSDASIVGFTGSYTISLNLQVTSFKRTQLGWSPQAGYHQPVSIDQLTGSFTQPYTWPSTLTAPSSDTSSKLATMSSAHALAQGTMEPYPVSSGSYSLSIVDLSYQIIKVTGTLTADVTLNFPASSIGHWDVVNATIGNGYNVYVAVAGQTMPSLSVPLGSPRSFVSDGATMYSNPASAQGVTTPTLVPNGDIVAFGDTSGHSLKDSGYSVAPVGHSIAALDNPNVFTAKQTFGSGSNLHIDENELINGGMDIDQRSEGNLNDKGIDRWSYEYTDNGSVTFNRVNSAPTGFTHSLQINGPTTANAKSILTAADVRRLRQAVEGGFVTSLNWGADIYSAKQAATISFYETCNYAGPQALFIQNSIASASYVHQYNIIQGGDWEYQQFTIPPPPPSLPFNPPQANTYSLSVSFDMGSGANYATKLYDQWLSGDYETTPAVKGIAGIVGGQCYITGVRMVPGLSTGEFTPRPYTIELALAQRYYYKTFNEGVLPGSIKGYTGALCVRAPKDNTYVSVTAALPRMYRGPGSATTIDTFNPIADNALWHERGPTNDTDIPIAVDPLGNAGPNGIELATKSPAITGGDDLCVHMVVDSHFN